MTDPLEPALASRTLSAPRHTAHYLESGAADGPRMMFLHGWPELSLIWRAQMDAFAADGWHCVAPDLRAMAALPSRRH
jgi:pimeloyl-ACP methyl ester carboxylesterase